MTVPAFVKVTASRTEPASEISVIVRDDEWTKLAELAAALPDNLTWEAQPVDGQSHRSGS